MYKQTKWILVLSFGILCGLFATIDVAAQETPSSLSIVPRSASFYMASMNHKAQYEAVTNSRAYQQLMDSPVGEKMRRAYRNGRRRGWDQFGENPFRDYLEGYAATLGSAPGRLGMTFLREIFRNEFFVYAGSDWNDAADAIGSAYGEVFQLMQGRDPSEFDEEFIQQLIPVLKEQLADVNTPTIVLGTVLDEPARIESLLDMAEMGLDQAMLQMPEEMDYLHQAFEMIKDDGINLMSFTLTSDMIPWEQISDPDIEPYLPDIQDILENKSINVSFGIKDVYLLISIGPSNEHILSLGNGALLIDHPKMSAVKDALAAGKRLTGVSYSSDELMQRSGDLDGLIQYLVMGLETGLRESGESDEIEALIDQIQSDADELSADLAEFSAQPGAHVSYSFLNAEGIEGFTYDWSENRSLDDSQPLTVLQHVGPDPALVFAAHENTNSAAEYAFARKWAGKLWDYAEHHLPRYTESGEQIEMVHQFMSQLKPILKRMDATTAERFIPATDGCQFALVCDLSTTHSTWHVQMPDADVPVALPGIAVAIEIQDADQIRAAGSEYLDSAKELLALLREMPEWELPSEFRISDPLSRKIGDADMYYYEIPDEAGLTGAIVPHALLSDEWLMFGFMAEQTPAMMNRHTPVFFGPLADIQRPAMSATYFDNRQWVDALYGWGQYALQLAREEGAELALQNHAESDQLDFSEAELLESLDCLVEFIKCFHGYSSISYMQNGVQVKHYQWKFADLSEN